MSDNDEQSALHNFIIEVKLHKYSTETDMITQHLLLQMGCWRCYLSFHHLLQALQMSNWNPSQSHWNQSSLYLVDLLACLDLHKQLHQQQKVPNVKYKTYRYHITEPVDKNKPPKITLHHTNFIKCRE